MNSKCSSLRRRFHIWEKWKIDKKQSLILLCVGVLLVIVAMPTKQTSSYGGNGTELEERLENILSQIEEAGEVRVMITVDNRDTVQGVAISAQGGEKPVVVKEITDVVQALFGIEMHKIKVMKGK